MSVVTTADLMVERSTKNLRTAVTKLTQVLYGDTWGKDEYSSEYIANIRAALEAATKALNALEE
jgi:hypothetical protein